MHNLESIKQTLLKQYKYRIELHAHTSPVSGCSEVPPEEVVKIYNSKGYDGVVITNHFVYDEVRSKEEVIESYLADFKAAQRIAEKCNIKVYLGAEIRFTENHNDYLIYGVDEAILSQCYDYLPRGVEAFRKEVELSSSVFLQAHPFRNGMVLCSPELLDGIETFNMHPNHNSRVGLAVRYAMENHMAVTTAGSDFHHKDRGHEAVSALRTSRRAEDSFDVAALLKEGDYIFEIGENKLVL